MTWFALLLVCAAPFGPPVPGDRALPSPLAVQTTPAPAPDPLVPVDAPLRISLRDALLLGLERDRDIRLRQLDSVIARTNETIAGSIYFPAVSLGARYSRFESARTGIQLGESGANDSHSISLQASQLIFDTAQGIFNLQRTHQLARAAELTELETALEVARQVASDFHDALREQALTTLADELREQAQRELELATARFETGAGARLDISRAEVARGNAEVEWSAAANRHREALARLRYDLLLPPGTPLEVTDDDPVPAIELSLDEALTAARTERPAIAAASATRSAQKNAWTAARISRWVDLTITANYERFLNSSRGVRQEYTLGGAIELPIFDGQEREARETAALSAHQQADQRYLQTVERAGLQVEQSHLTWTDAVARLGVAISAADLAAETLAEVEESFRLGVASFLDVADARTEYRRAVTNRIQARIERDLASINLRLAVGRFPLPPREGPRE